MARRSKGILRTDPSCGSCYADSSIFAPVVCNCTLFPSYSSVVWLNHNVFIHTRVRSERSVAVLSSSIKKVPNTKLDA